MLNIIKPSSEIKSYMKYKSNISFINLKHKNKSKIFLVYAKMYTIINNFIVTNRNKYLFL